MRVVFYKSVAAAVLLASLGVGWLWMGYQAFLRTPLNVPEQGAHFVVKAGATVTRIAEELEREGVLANPRYFIWMARWHGSADRIKTGEYLLRRGMTPGELLDDLVAGKVIQYSLTLVEGWTFRQVMDAVESNEFLDHSLQGLDDDAVMVRLGHPGEHPEGRFFPDTYHFPRGTTDVDFLKRAYRAMAEHLAREWEAREIGLPIKTPYQALILASIIEKETALPSERREIAGVFVRRLQKGMRLQTDPTVIYGLGSRFDGNLRRRDLETDTPYNTYRHRGLPPTPIAMPGLASLHAALHPDEGDALYFVARGDGSHQFSSTLEQHNRAVIKYQLGGHPHSFSSYNGDTPATSGAEAGRAAQ